MYAAADFAGRMILITLVAVGAYEVGKKVMKNMDDASQWRKHKAAGAAS